MLAFHYSNGEDENRAEEYLIKAGEEALKSSASSEALHYYLEALNLYMKKYRDAADPEKVTMLEKNIALALFNKGRFIEAVELFDKALAYYGVKTPKYFFSVIFKFIIGFLDFLISLYLPFLKWKRTPTQKDNEIIALLYKRGIALTQTDPKRFSIESFYLSRILTNFNLTKVESGAGIVAGFCNLFTISGISFRLGKKILKFTKDKVDKNDVKSVLYYEVSELVYNWISGEWYNVKEYDDNLINQALRKGEIFDSVAYIGFQIGLNLDRGCLVDAQRMLDNLYSIADVYEHDNAKAWYYAMNVSLLWKYRRLDNILDKVEQAINFTNKVGFKLVLITIYMVKFRIQFMLNDINSAESSLSYMKEFLSQIEAAPLYLELFLICQFLMDLHKLEESMKNGDPAEIGKNRKRVLKTGKKMIDNSRKVVTDRTEALRLMGVYYWLIGKQKKALRWWNESIKVGEQLNARLELSRTYMEVGKHLLEKNGKYKKLNGISAEEYINKARSIIEDIELQWDLEELEKISISNLAVSN